VIEDRPNHSAREPSPFGALPKRVRSWLRLRLSADAALPRPRAVRLEPIRRSWPGAFWQARISVRAGVSLDDYLRSRLARYLSALQVPRARLPIWIDVEDAQIVAGPHEQERRVGTATPAPDAWLAALVVAEGPAVRNEVSELELRLAQLEGESDTARRRSEDLSRRLAADVAAGLVPAPSAVEATPEQLGRPAVRSALPQTALLVFAGLAALAEAWQVAVPLLRGAGVDPSALAREAARRPVEVAFAVVFALGIAAGLVGLARTSLGALDALAAEHGEGSRHGWQWASAVGAALLGVSVATALATLPAPANALPAWSAAVLLVAMPVGITLVLRAARALSERREDEVFSALIWDRERVQALTDRARRIEEISWAQEQERDLERQREAARARVREISARASAASRLAASAEHREGVALSRLAQSLVSALELDRYEFVRQATAQGADSLLAPRRRPVSQDRGTRGDGQLTPAVVAVGVDRGDGGRMAS
jgi:hypothetical protein